MKTRAPLAVRWTIGDVSDHGFESLRLSAWGARRVFGREARLAVCVNSVAIDAAIQRAGPMPEGVEWHRVGPADIPPLMRRHLDPAMAEGVGWKLAPWRLFPDCYELSLDNDCVLWEVPGAIGRWLEEGDPTCVIAEDVRRCFGKFASLCGPGARNSGIRGLPPGFDLEAAIGRVLRENPCLMTSELDEQGLQVAALSGADPPGVVSVREVTICSPFPPHAGHLGECGAHFVGLNARDLGWELAGKPATEHLREHWQKHRRSVAERVGLRELVG